MKLPHDKINELVQECAALCTVNFEYQEQQVKVIGQKLIEQGNRLDAKGNPIQPGQMYMWPGCRTGTGKP